MGGSRRSRAGMKQGRIDERTDRATGGKLIQKDVIATASGGELSVIGDGERENGPHFIGKRAPGDGLCCVNVTGSALLDPEFQERQLVGREIGRVHFVVGWGHERFLRMSGNVEKQAV